MTNMRLLEQIPVPPDSGFRPFGADEVAQSIARRFEQQVRAHGDRLAVKADGVQYSYASLNETANRLARTILARRGPSAEPVALMFAHGGDALAAILGVLKAGKFYVALDPDYPADRLRYMLADSGTRLMLTDARHRDDAMRLCGSSIELIDFGDVDPQLPGTDPADAAGPDSLAMILYTSGSTGHPKGVLHTHAGVLVDARNLTNGWGVNPRDRWLLATSLSFASSVRTIYGSLLNGAAVFPFDVKAKGFRALAAWMADNGITIVRGVPTFFRGFMATLDARQTFPAVRVLSLGGESMLRADLRYFNRHFSPHCVLSHAFGPSECLTVCWAFIPHGTAEGDGKLPIGYSLPDKDVLLLDASRREVAGGEVGEIAVRSRYISPGYWRDPERTGAAFLPDPAGSGARIYLTGDLGWRGQDGRLFHAGRQDFQVKIRGYRVDVTEIESALRAIAGVGDAVVAGREFDPGEQRLVAYYVASGEPPVSAGALRGALARKLPDYMIPEVFVAMDAIPQTPTGKTDRLALPLPARSRRDADAPMTAPRLALEAELAKMWAEVLDLDQVGITDTFLSLGGNSLQASMIAARVAARFDVDVPMRTLLESGTVAAMAEVLGRHGSVPPAVRSH